AEGVTTDDIAGQENHIDREDNGPHANSKTVWKPECLAGIVDQDAPNQVGEAEKVTVKILEDQRKTAFSEVRLAWLADGAGWRIGPERLVISAPVVVARQPEKAGYPKN